MSSCLFDSRVPSDTRAKADLGVGPAPATLDRKKLQKEKSRLGKQKSTTFYP